MHLFVITSLQSATAKNIRRDGRRERKPGGWR